jgi:hypothetical protein
MIMISSFSILTYIGSLYLQKNTCTAKIDKSRRCGPYQQDAVRTPACHLTASRVQIAVPLSLTIMTRPLDCSDKDNQSRHLHISSC